MTTDQLTPAPSFLALRAHDVYRQDGTVVGRYDANNLCHAVQLAIEDLGLGKDARWSLWAEEV